MKRSTPVVLSHQNSPTYLFSLINLWLHMHIFNLVTGEYNIMDRENSYFSQEQWFKVKAVLMDLLQSRGWHGSGFSNLSHPVPIPRKNWGKFHPVVVSQKNFSLYYKHTVCGLLALLVDYFDVFISCLDSFYWHTFTAEDPLVSKWCNATFLQIRSNEETNSSSWIAWGVSTF